MKKVLTIAGSDCSGGAGIQADIKTMLANGVYAMSVITALTAQNTTGVISVKNTDPEFLRQQIDAVFEDIFPDAVKIGMVPDEDLIEVIAERMKFYNAKNIVTDPEPGMIYTGKVVRIMNFGAFVELAPNKDGLVHISKMRKERVNKVEDVVNIGDEVTVKVIEIDRMGRINLSMKDV